MKIEIQLPCTVATVDTDSSLSQMQNRCGIFFKTKFGLRETYTEYRGQLIVRYTAREWQGWGGKRYTAVYLYLVANSDLQWGMPDLFCVAGCDVNSIAQAKRLIDRVLDEKRVAYGMKFPEQAVG